MIHIYKDIYVDDSKIRYQRIRCSGPGGQNVNKVSSGIRLQYDLKNCRYPDWFIKKLKKNGKKYISESEIINIKSISYRTQSRNKKEALKRMVDLFKNSAKLAKRRIKTKPSLKAQKKRMDSKIKRSQKKTLRKNPILNENNF